MIAILKVPLKKFVTPKTANVYVKKVSGVQDVTSVWMGSSTIPIANPVGVPTWVRAPKFAM